MRRFTMKELEEKSDDWILYHIVTGKIQELTNPYTPLYSRLTKIQGNIEERLIEANR